MRLDKFISQGLFISRSDAKKLIQHKQISVDGQVLRDTGFQVNADQQIRFNDNNGNSNVVTLIKARYFILNKPPDFVCSHQEDSHPSVLTLLNEPNLDGLHFAGRLDADSTGLLLITDDGQWSHRITAPSTHCQKSYLVTLDRKITDQAIIELEQGVLLRSETEPTLPATVLKIDDYQIQIKIKEGRYHQVKRMLAAVGNHVLALHRLQIGDLSLDINLTSGCYRSLTDAEIALFKPKLK